MIERVHEHLIGELRQNARTDTVFVLTAILLNLAILGANSAVGGMDTTEYTPQANLMEGTHRLYAEVQDEDGWWRPVGRAPVIIDFAKASGEEESADGTWVWHIPVGSVNVRYRLDGSDSEGWAMHTESDSGAAVQTIVMYILILLSVFLNIVVVLGLLRGKRMRLALLDGLMSMYRDQNVEKYYNELLLGSYSVRYHVFISVVAFLGVVSVAIPLVVRYF